MAKKTRNKTQKPADTKVAQESQSQIALNKYREHSEYVSKKLIPVGEKISKIRKNNVDFLEEREILEKIATQLLPPNRLLQEKFDLLFRQSSDGSAAGLLNKLTTCAAIELRSASDSWGLYSTEFCDFKKIYSMQQYLRKNSKVAAEFTSSLLPLLTAHLQKLDELQLSHQEALKEAQGLLVECETISRAVRATLREIFDIVTKNAQLQSLLSPTQQQVREQKTDEIVDTISQLQTRMSSLESSITLAENCRTSARKLTEEYACVIEKVKSTPQHERLEGLCPLKTLGMLTERLDNLTAELLNYQSILQESELDSRIRAVIAIATVNKNTNKEARKTGNGMANMLLPTVDEELQGLEICISELNRFATLYNIVKNSLESPLKALSQEVGTANESDLSGQLSRVQAELALLSVGSETKTAPPTGPVFTPAANNTSNTVAITAVLEQQPEHEKKKKKKKKKKQAVKSPL